MGRRRPAMSRPIRNGGIVIPMNARRGVTLLAAVLFALSSGACGEDKPNGPEMVTVSGVVRNIDTAQLAAGIRVSLLGTGYSDVVPTGSDGRYSLKVPKGSTIYLLTEDFNPGQTDNWFPLINVEVTPIIANSDIPDYPIHSCPQTDCAHPAAAGVPGSVADWDYYLQSLDQANGDLFVPTSSAASGGVVAFIVADCSNGNWNQDSVTVTSDSPDFPVGYCNGAGFAAGCGTPEMIYPATRTATDPGGLVFSFGKPQTTLQTVRFRFSDALTTPYRSPKTPLDIPVRPGTISLIWTTTVSGSPANFKQFACHCIDAATFCTP